MNKHFKPSAFMDNLGWLQDYLVYEIPPGKPFIPLYYGVNLNKGTMMIYIFSMMCYYDNFSLGAWIYLALHGNYGIVWYIKDRTFPDIGFERPTTLVSALVPWVTVLIPYYFIGYWIITGGEA